MEETNNAQQNQEIVFFVNLILLIYFSIPLLKVLRVNAVYLTFALRWICFVSLED